MEVAAMSVPKVQGFTSHINGQGKDSNAIVTNFLFILSFEQSNFNSIGTFRKNISSIEKKCERSTILMQY